MPFKKIMKQKDNIEFIKVIEHKINIYEYRNYYKICYQDKIPKGIKSIISIWAFKRKHLLDSMLVKHKARIYSHSS